MFVDLETFSPAQCTLSRLGSAQAVQLAEKNQLLNDFHLGVEAAFFWQITHALEHFATKRSAEHVDLAGIRQGDADHHSYRAGLAGAIRPQQSEHGTGPDGEREIVDSDKLVVCLANGF